jgi:hypothetical protein
VTVFTKWSETGSKGEGVFVSPVGILSRKRMMTIRTILLCWLCGRATDLKVELFTGSSLGSPRYWCSRCTSSPRIFARRLRERLETLEAQGTLLGADAELFNALSWLEAEALAA